MDQLPPQLGLLLQGVVFLVGYRMDANVVAMQRRAFVASQWHFHDTTRQVFHQFHSTLV